jgi:hypothetical protein
MQYSYTFKLKVEKLIKVVDSKSINYNLGRLLCRFDVIDELVLSPSSTSPSNLPPVEIKRQVAGDSPHRTPGE